MAQKIKPNQIEMPPHMSGYPSVLPLFRADDSFRGDGDTETQWAKKIEQLKKDLGVAGSSFDAGDRMVVKSNQSNRVFQVYKPSQSFLYYDRDLVSPSNLMFAEQLLSNDAAQARARQLLTQQGLLDEHIAFEGFAYTGVTVNDPHKALENSDGKEYRTEIKVCFNFRIGNVPVLGPGAKSMVSFTGNKLSQWCHFWRKPDVRAVAEQKILPPDFVQKQIAADPRFSHLEASESKIRLNEIKLGYYASPPFVFQQGYLPVYQLRGTLETRTRESGAGFFSFGKPGSDVGSDFLRYNFNLFVPAANLKPAEHRASGFDQPMAGSVFF